MKYFPNAVNLLNQLYGLQQAGAKAEYARPAEQMALLEGQSRLRSNAARTLLAELTAKYMPERSLAEIANIKSQAGLHGAQARLSDLTAKYLPEKSLAEIANIRSQARLHGARAGIDELTAKYLPERNMAEIANIRAQAGLHGAQARGRDIANKLAIQTMPYEISRSKLGAIKDPLTRMLVEQQEAQRLGVMPKTSPQDQQAGQDKLISALFDQAGLQRTGDPTTDRLLAGQVYKNFASMAKGENTIQGRRELAIQKAQATRDLRKEIADKRYVDNISKAIPEAQRTIETIDLALDNYNKTSLTGPVLGRIPGVFSEEAQLAGKYLSTLKGQMARELGGSKGATVKDIQLAGEIKPSRSDNPEAVVSQLMTMKALLRRNQEYAKFIGAAIEDHGMTPNKAEAAWNKYIKENPLVNNKTRKVIDSHIDNWGSYLPRTEEQKIAGAENLDLSRMSNEQLMAEIAREEASR